MGNAIASCFCIRSCLTEEEQKPGVKRNKAFFSLLLWAALIVGLAIYLTLDISQSIESYRNPTWISTINESDRVPFPGVVMCPINGDANGGSLGIPVCRFYNTDYTAGEPCSAVQWKYRDHRLGGPCYGFNVRSNESVLATATEPSASGNFSRMIVEFVASKVAISTSALWAPVHLLDTELDKFDTSSAFFTPDFFFAFSTRMDTLVVVSKERRTFHNGDQESIFQAVPTSAAVDGNRASVQLMFTYSTTFVTEFEQRVSKTWGDVLANFGGVLGFAEWAHLLVTFVCANLVYDSWVRRQGHRLPHSAPPDVKRTRESCLCCLPRKAHTTEDDDPIESGLDAMLLKQRNSLYRDD